MNTGTTQFRYIASELVKSASYTFTGHQYHKVNGEIYIKIRPYYVPSHANVGIIIAPLKSDSWKDLSSFVDLELWSERLLIMHVLNNTPENMGIVSSDEGILLMWDRDVWLLTRGQELTLKMRFTEDEIDICTANLLKHIEREKKQIGLATEGMMFT